MFAIPVGSPLSGESFTIRTPQMTRRSGIVEGLYGHRTIHLQFKTDAAWDNGVAALSLWSNSGRMAKPRCKAAGLAVRPCKQIRRWD